MRHSDHGVTKDKMAQDQPTDKARARAAHKTHPDKSATREATRDPELNDPEKTPGSGMTPNDRGDAPSG